MVDLLNIGDLLFTTPALRALRQAYLYAHIDMLVNEHISETVRYNPNLDHVIGIDKNGYHNSPHHFLELVGSIRRVRYDLVINLHGCARSSLIALLSGARRRVGLVSRRFDWTYHQAVIQRLDMHRADSHLEILRELGLCAEPPTDESVRLEMHSDPESVRRAVRLWEEQGLCGETVVGLSPGASVAVKRWRPEGWAELANLLDQQGLTPAFFGGKKETRLVDEILSMTDASYVSFTGKLTLCELAAMVAKCAVFVSCDSGPLHVAVSQGVPVVGLYGPTKPLHFGPYHVPHVICSAKERCERCRTGRGDEHTCLTQVPVSAVFDGVKQLLRGQDQAARPRYRRAYHAT